MNKHLLLIRATIANLLACGIGVMVNEPTPNPVVPDRYYAGEFDQALWALHREVEFLYDQMLWTSADTERFERIKHYFLTSADLLGEEMDNRDAMTRRVDAALRFLAEIGVHIPTEHAGLRLV